MKKLLFYITLFLSVCACKESQNSALVNNDWEIIFDGSSTASIRGYGIEDFPEGVWTVVDGALVANPDTANRDLITRGRYKNFELECEWAVDTAGNSGIFFHVQEDLEMVSHHGNSPNWLDNFELQVLDDIYFHDTTAIRSAGALYDLIPPKNKQLKPIGAFNKARLIHVDGHVEHWLNGQKVVEFEIGSPEIVGLISNSKFRENAGYHSDKEGHIMFQHHGQRVYYRNIRVRKL